MTLRVTAEWFDAYRAKFAKQLSARPHNSTDLAGSGGRASLPWSENVELVGSPIVLGCFGPHVLPWPPTGNHAVRHANSAHYLTPGVKEYRREVARRMAAHRGPARRFRIEVIFQPRDNRRRDFDNALKTLLDALVKCQWIPDDKMSVMRELTARVGPARDGTVIVSAWEST